MVDSLYTIIPAKYAYLLKTDLDDSRAAILERELKRKTLIKVHVSD